MSKREEDDWQANEKENNSSPEAKRSEEISDSDLEKAEVEALQLLEKGSFQLEVKLSLIKSTNNEL